jgi:hypothetical protein
METVHGDVAMTPELQKIADALWRQIVTSFPDDPRNHVEPFATGVE